MAQARVEIPFGSSNLIIESGKIAKQANGAVTLSVGGTVVLVTACMAKKPREGMDFFPLTVEYQEKLQNKRMELLLCRSGGLSFWSLPVWLKNPERE